MSGLHAPLELVDKPSPEPWKDSAISGPPEFVAELLHRYAEAGVNHVVLAFGGSPKTRIATIEKIVRAAEGLVTREPFSTRS